MPMQREYGQEHPFWPLGPFKLRLPFIHYRWEFPEMIQAFLMFVVSLGMIPLLQQYLGLPYEAALAGVVICGIGFMLPALMGVPLVPGWITPAIPVVLLYLQNFEPGPEAVKAMVALQIEVCVIFLVLGITGLGDKLVTLIPNSLKCGIIIGAGIAAMMGELKAGGRVSNAPFSILMGAMIAAYILFSLSFKSVVLRSRAAKIISNFGMVPGIVVAMLIGWVIGEFPLPDIQWGITKPDFGLLFSHLAFNVGWPDWNMFLLAAPTAVIAYVIAFGDILVGFTLVKRADHQRPDEVIENNGHSQCAACRAGPLARPGRTAVDARAGRHCRTLRAGPQVHGYPLRRAGRILDFGLSGAVCAAAGLDVQTRAAVGAVAVADSHGLYLHHGGHGRAERLRRTRCGRHCGRHAGHARYQSHHLRHRGRAGAVFPD